MVLHGELSEIVSEHESLSGHAWFGLGGPARWFAQPRTVEQLAELVRRCRSEGVATRVIGLGANLLVGDDGVDGMVFRLGAPSFRAVDWETAGSDGDGDEITIVAGGGADMNRLALDAVRRGLAGLEFMAGIPGTLGGIIRMNAGGRYGEIADVVRDVTVVDCNGLVRTLTPDALGFRYRGSHLSSTIVCQASLTLRRGDPVALRERFLDYWRDKKRSQPMADMSAGCVFKNPPNGSAGALIDQAGFKGRSVGGATVSPKHANFIVAKEGTTASDVLALIGLIRREVAERFGIELELEIEVWGRQRSLRPQRIG